MRPFALAVASSRWPLRVARERAGRCRARHDPEKLPDTRIRDLHYGDVLFYFYQDEDFEAITRLTAYRALEPAAASRGRGAAAARRPVSVARHAQRGRASASRRC